MKYVKNFSLDALKMQRVGYLGQILLQYIEVKSLVVPVYIKQII